MEKILNFWRNPDENMMIDQDDLLDSESSTSLNLFQNYERYDRETTPPSNNWTRFGTVKKLLVYPVDRGNGLSEETVICTKTGPKFYTENPSMRSVKDRALVIYKTGSNNVKLKPKDVMLHYDHKMSFYYGNIPSHTTRVMDMIYENWEIPIHIQKDSTIYCQALQLKYQERNENFRIAYCKPEDRSLFNSRHRYAHENWNIHGLHANYSHYTIVNTRSIDAFKKTFNRRMIKEKRNLRAKDVDYVNFFPHIVIEGDPGTAYQEDAIVAMKIANVKFDQILPCVHYEEDFRLNNKKNDKLFKHMYRCLKDVRSINNCFTEYNHDDSEIPAFGLNMEKAAGGSTDEEYNTISENNIVYVKFRDASNPLASNPP